MICFKKRIKPVGISKALLLITFIILLLQGCTYYEGTPSGHFDGSRFFDTEPDNTFIDHLKWLWEMETVEWPEWIDDPPQPPPISHVNEFELRVTFINHATVLMQMDGFNILTDPIWSERAGPISRIGSKRIRSPGVKLDELPKIDIILISHDHYDHLDIPTIERLVNKHQPIILVGLGLKTRLKTIRGNEIIELDWWGEYNYSGKKKITFVPARHNSGRGFFDTNKTLWGGFVINGSSGNVLFLGDSAYGNFLKEIKKHFPRFALAILPIGSYEKRWFMKRQHMNPDDAVRVHQMLNASQSMGIHFGTFKEHPEQSIDAHEKDLKAALIKYNVSESEFFILEFGEGRYFIR